MINISTRTTKKQEKGVGVIEVAIGLPLFLGFIFLTYWAAIYFNARTSLSSALPQAMRMAQTRSNLSMMGGGVHTAIDCFYFFRGETTVPYENTIDPALCEQFVQNSGPWASVGEAMYNKNHALSVADGATVILQTHAGLALFEYDSKAKFCDPNTTIEELPRNYIYSLAYLYAIMRKSIGPALRYPCNPNSTIGTNCLRCEFSLPDIYYQAPDSYCADGLLYIGQQEPRPFQRLHLTCEYRASTTLSDGILRFFGSTSSDFSVIRVEGHS